LSFLLVVIFAEKKKEGLTQRLRLRVIALLFIVWPSIAFSIEGIVTKVKDGDTVVISPLSGENQFTCRLYGIDAPEAGQMFGDEAREELKALIFRQQVRVTLTGKKSYKREICLIETDGMDINWEMVARGYAWAYREYLKGPYASEYIEAEKEARAKRLGLWQQANPQPPWEFRKMARMN